MIRIALATLRSRAASYAGAFLALALGTSIIAMMALTLGAVSSTEFHGPQRYAQAPAVVTAPVTLKLKDDDGDPREFPMVAPKPLPARVVQALSGTGRTVQDRTFSAQLPGGPDEQVGHPWGTAAFTPYRLVNGHAPASAREIVVGGGDPSLVGRTVRVATATGFGDYRVVGVTAPVWFENAVFFADQEAARLSPEVGAVVAYGTVESVRAAVQGTGARVLTGADRLKAEHDQNGGRDQLRDAEGMAGTSMMLVVFVVVFVVIATFAFVVDQRRREVALLRTVGATPGQVRRMVLAEAFLLAVLASAVGCAAGIPLTGVLRAWMVDHGVAPSWLAVDARPAPLVISFCLGLLSAMIGTAVVSWRAGRVRPAEALREATGRRRAATPVRLVLGGVLLVLGVQKSAGAINSDQVIALSMQNYLFVPVLLVGGCALLTPLLVRPVVTALTWPLGRLGAGAMVVREGALFAGRRTAAVATPVVLAVGLGAALFTAQDAANAANVAGLRAESRADYILSAQGDGEIGPAVIDRVRAIPGATVAVYTPAEVRLSGDGDRYLGTLSAFAVDPRALTATRQPSVVDGSLERLGDDFLVLDHDTAGEFGIRTGDRVKAWLPDGTSAPLRVAAESRTTVTGEIGYVPAARAGGARPTQIEVKVAPGGDTSAVAAALRSAVHDRPVKLSTRSSLLDAEQADQQRKTRLATGNVFGIALAFALIAIANTLVMAAPDRRRELSALTLAGATRRKTLAFVAAETVVATVAGAVLAGVAAISVVAGQRAALTKLVGGFQMTVPWTSILAVTAVCAVTALCTSVIATRLLVGGPAPRGE
ncbi:ABC transporter permease [Actinomadura barringtoniae]|uniref:ABC transporter permease n=1 Tax=Actinomadura barringtoniae TaxID=1427535 RepID=A0A939PK94_9ACTN|nr:ABC transporter permease [Actinomadura barringtoniae]MBO2454467.1 ABC transporter permease [Actinomadura barringtoniae]